MKRLATAQSRAHRDQLGFYERLLRFGLVEASSPQRATLEKAVVTKGCGGRRPSPSPARASGPAVVIDAAAVIGAFQRIVRTADATGLDGSAVAAMDLGPHPVEA